MESFIKKIKQKAKKNPKKIIFPESLEERVLKAVSIILKEKTAMPILLGSSKKVSAKAKKLGLNIKGAEIIDHIKSKKFDQYAKELFRLREHKGLTLKQAKDMLKNPVYYGTMAVYFDGADGLISGSTHSTGQTIMPALQIIKTKEVFHKVSGVFFMLFKNHLMLFADAAVEIDPDAKDLAEIAIDTAQTAVRFGIKPRIAMLSFSTKGSAKHPLADKVIEATKIVQYRKPNLIVEGEMQLDAAVSKRVCKVKCPKCKLQGSANVLIFPDLQSANISYKMAEYFGGAKALGPVLQGLKKPINDLSRGCTTEDIVNMTAITVIEAQEREK
ncbi:phosphate acetyltransferase [Candidatus Woesearchaeota archaeon]|nr:phosphate acetyltransferase [Candidatus Woesearchaeota archaeon]